MKRLLFLFVLCTLWLSCSAEAIKVSGKVLGLNGRATLKLSSTDSRNRQSISSADVDANGSFVLAAPAGWYALWVTVESQQALRIPIYLDKGGAQGSAYSEIGRKFRDGGRLWSIPKPILVSPQGEILATHFSLMGDNLEPTLNKFLNQ